MCGIVGVARREARPGDMAAVETGVAALAPRGPDAQRVVRVGSVVLGTARLSIRGGVDGAQPRVGSQPADALAWNGQIYAVDGRKIVGSDTRWLFDALAESGSRALRAAHGMYAIAWWSGRARALTLLRDRWGQKPLYIADLADGGLAFASEPKALRAVAGIDWSIDHHALHLLLRHGYIPGERTGWHGVRKLRPGARLVWSPGEARRLSVDGPEPPSSAISSSDEAREALGVALQSAVHECLPEDQPAGLLLSGGLDSSSVGALWPGRPPAWTITWREPAWDESAHASVAADALQLNHTRVPCGPHDLTARLDALVHAADEPVADESILPTALVCAAACREVRVVLGGDGADELFGGYGRYGWAGPDAAYIDTFAAAPHAVLDRLVPGHDGLDAWHLARLDEVRSAPTLNRRRWLDINGYLPDQVLTKVDRMSMRVGLECRAPILSPAVARLALEMAPELLFRADTAKWILRETMRGRLPEQVRSRAKQGFGVPTIPWFRGSLRRWAEGRLRSEVLDEIQGLDMDAARCLVAEHAAHAADHGRPIFGLICIEAWLRQQAVHGNPVRR